MIEAESFALLQTIRKLFMGLNYCSTFVFLLYSLGGENEFLFPGLCDHFYFQNKFCFRVKKVDIA